MACTGSCTWTFKSGAWQVTGAGCSAGCVCADAITMGASLVSIPPAQRPYFDPANPAIAKPTLVKVSGASITVDHTVMFQRLKFLTDLAVSNPTAWSALDTALHGNRTATAQISAAWAIVSVFPPPTLPPAPSAAVAPTSVNLPCTGP